MHAYITVLCMNNTIFLTSDNLSTNSSNELVVQEFINWLLTAEFRALFLSRPCGI